MSENKIANVKFGLGVLLFAGFIAGLFMAVDYDKKHRYDNTEWRQFDIVAIRVDDDAEYHITARNPYNGYVFSLDDQDDFELSVSYGNVDQPVLRVLYKTSSGDAYELQGERKRVILPINYSIQTFDD